MGSVILQVVALMRRRALCKERRANGSGVEGIECIYRWPVDILSAFMERHKK